MRGIDIYWGDGIPEKYYNKSDFVIVKATQGISYGHTSYFYQTAKKVISDGKLLGAYHYAGGHDPVREADYFLSVVKGYVGKAILCLDWQFGQNDAWGSTSWCKKFIDRVKEQTGITCFLYTGLDGIQQNKGLSKKVPLWFAGYPKGASYSRWTPPKFPYDISPWKNYAIWQYTSTNEKCDRNTTDMTKDKWKDLAKGVTKKHYSGKYPSMPKRGYFKLWDGIHTLITYRTQIKRVQRILNWVMDYHLEVDGMYGEKTQKAVKQMQKRFGLDINGCYGEKCQKKARAFTK